MEYFHEFSGVKSGGELSTELDGQIFTLSLSRVFYSSDAARTKYLTRYLASFSISTELRAPL